MGTQEDNCFLHGSPRRFMVSEVLTVGKKQTLKSVFSALRKKGMELKSVDEAYVVDEDQKLVGVLPLKDLFGYPEGTVVEKVMRTKIFTASPKMDVEKIAHLALKHDITAVPIVESGKLVGVIPSKSIASILNQALRKDLFHFAGIHRSHLEYENSLTVPLSKSIIHRVPWLIVGLAGVLMLAAFMGVFEGILEKYIILVFFMPAIVYLSSALGTQLQTLFIRDLTTMGEELKFAPYLIRQMAIALLIAFIISSTMFAVILLFWSQPYLAFVISLSTLASLILTSFTALMITIAIKKLGYDPALGSGPFATLVSDATSIAVYFIIATVLL